MKFFFEGLAVGVVAGGVPAFLFAGRVIRKAKAEAAAVLDSLRKKVG
jgi:hypothetical protein